MPKMPALEQQGALACNEPAEKHQSHACQECLTRLIYTGKSRDMGQ
jgi:hypothetical protein